MKPNKSSHNTTKSLKPTPDFRPWEWPSGPSKWYYKVQRWYCRWALLSFLGKVRVYGRENIPTDKPVIYCSNHQNTLIDGMVLSYISPFRSYIYTRYDIHQIPLFSLFVKIFGLIPLFRRIDGLNPMEANSKIFDFTFEKLAEGRGFVIFPEGGLSFNHFLRPVKMGIFHLVVQALQHPSLKDLQIVPVGINYFVHSQPRQTVMVVFGDPIPASSMLEESGKDGKEASKTLFVRRISEEIQKCLLYPSDSEDYSWKRPLLHNSHAKLGFHELKRRLSLREPDLPLPAHRKWLARLGYVLGMVNFLSFFIEFIVLKRFVTSSGFEGGVRLCVWCYGGPLFIIGLSVIAALFFGATIGFALLAVWLVLSELKHLCIIGSNPRNGDRWAQE